MNKAPTPTPTPVNDDDLIDQDDNDDGVIMKINIYLKNGDQYIYREPAISDNMNMIAFWQDENTIRLIPINDVSYAEYVFIETDEE